LYTSLPAGKHWTAYINGVKTDIIQIGGCMAALELKAGTYFVEFKYYNKDLKAGIIISFTALAIFFGVLIRIKLQKKNL